ncbi:hypothetical protein D3C73_614320 [compost metagenome]
MSAAQTKAGGQAGRRRRPLRFRRGGGGGLARGRHGRAAARQAAVAGHGAHQAHRLGQHLIVAAHAILEAGVQRLCVRGRLLRGGGQSVQAFLDGGADSIDPRPGFVRQAGGALVHLGDGLFDRAQNIRHLRQGGLQAFDQFLAGHVDHVSRLGDDAAGAVDAGLGGLIGLLGRVEQGFAQPVGADLRLFDRRLRGGALLVGRGLEHLQRAPRLLEQQVAGFGGQGLEPIQRQLGGVVEAVGLALGHVHQGLELIDHRIDLGLDGGGGVIALLVQVVGGGAGLGQVIQKLGALALDLSREILLVGAQGIGGRDQGGALLAQAFLNRLNLFGDARAGGLEPQGLPREIVGGGAGGLLRLAGGGGQVGGAGGQGGLGLAKLGLGQVGGVRHHARLALDRLDHGRGLAFQLAAQSAHLFALVRQLFGEAPRRAAGQLGRFVEQAGFLDEGLAQRRQVVAGALGRLGGAVDVVAQGVQHLPRLIGGQGGRPDQGVGHFAGAPRLLRQSRSLTHGVGQKDGEAYRRQQDQGVNRQAQGIDLHHPRTQLIGEPGRQAPDPKGRGQAGDQIGVARSRRGRSLRGSPGRWPGRRGGRRDGGGRGVGGLSERRQGARGLFGLGGALLGQGLLLGQAPSLPFGHRTRRRRFGGRFQNRLGRGGRDGGLADGRGGFRLDQGRRLRRGGLGLGQVERRPMAGFHGRRSRSLIAANGGEGRRRGTLTAGSEGEKARARNRSSNATAISGICGSAGRGGGHMDLGRRRAVAAFAHTLNLTVRLLRGVQIDAELRQRRCGEQGDQAGQHLDQSLHGANMPESASGDNAAKT